MESKFVLIAMAMLVVLASPLSSAQNSPPAPTSTPTPSPAPAPAPDYVNLTEILSVAGPFGTFLEYLLSTKIMDTLQNQANNTERGVTIFVPKDSAFASQKNPSLKNLTSDQLKQLLLFHALPQYYALASFRNLSKSNPISTMAGGGGYGLNFTDVSGTVHISSGWTNTKISSSVHSTDPVALYQVDKVLLPVAIFGTDIPPMPPAPAPAPDVAPAADSPGSSDANSPTKSSPGKSAASAVDALSHLALAASAGVVALVMLL